MVGAPPALNEPALNEPATSATAHLNEPALNEPAPREPAPENSAAIALGLMGDEWNLTIVKLAIMHDVRRYKEFRERLGIANSVLTARLRRLAEAGVFTMSQYSQAPRRYEYVLTDCGRDLWKVLLTIWWWEAAWVTEHIEPLPPMYHTECGAEFTPVMRCRTCGRRPAPGTCAARLARAAVSPARCRGPPPAAGPTAGHRAPAWSRRRSS